MNISVHTTYVFPSVRCLSKCTIFWYDLSAKWKVITWIGLNGIHKHAIAPISNKITFCVWFIPQYVFINNASFRCFFQPWFSFSIISHKLFTSISKEIYCGHINHRKLFQCCFMIDDKVVKESRFAYSWFAVWAW